MGTGEFKACVERLDRFVAAADKLLALVGEPQVLSGAAKAQARAQLRGLKAALASEKGRMRKPGVILSDAEQRYYQPAIEQAAAYLTLRVNSVPGRLWRLELYDLQTTLECEDLRRELRESFRIED